MDESHVYMAGIFILAMLATGFAFQLAHQEPIFVYGVTINGTNLENVQVGSYSYTVEIENSLNRTIQIYSYILSDPEEFRTYITYKSSVKNGSKLLPSQKATVTFSLTVSEHPFPDGELYLRVAYSRTGEDS